MSLRAAAETLFDALDDDLQVTFDDGEITIYWQNLRLDVQPKDLGKALKLIKRARALGARFE